MPAFILPYLNFFRFFALSTLCLSFLWNTQSIAALPKEYIHYQKILQEERAWAGLTSKSLRVGDIQWSYSEGGSKTQPTLLLIHGMESNRDSWNKIAQVLTRQYHVIIPDLPGNGDTRIPANFDMSLSHLTEQLRRFTEAAHIQNNLNLAGHSLGGSIALLYASEYAFDTKSLYLISTGGIFQNSGTAYLNNPIFLKQLMISKPGDLNFVMKKVMVNPPFIPEIIKKEQERSYIAHSTETAKLISQLYDSNQRYNVDSFKSILKKVQAPTLILWGQQDPIVNVEVARELQSAIKNAQPPVILNNVGHIPTLEAPEQVTQNYLNFLAQLYAKKQ